jgi:two-component system chemotaxis response regulator CheY
MTVAEHPGLKILLIEDETFIRTTLKKILRALGHPEVCEASDGSEALSALRFGYSPDLILCDVKMAPMDGLTFVQHLRALPKLQLAETPVIMLTVSSDGQTIHDALELGISDYLLKPVSPRRLAEQIEVLLARKGRQSEWATLLHGLADVAGQNPPGADNAKAPGVGAPMLK